MASPDVVRGEASPKLSFEKEILRDGVSIPGLSRRDSTSTTGSGKPPPPGHWTFPISGNCPRCHHHHRSIKLHIRSAKDSIGLIDVHCEKCNKLWLGPGGRNSTRISLASIETIDPPPLELEAQTALVHAIRSATRVAALFPTLPNIPETVAGPLHGPSTRDPNRGGAHKAAATLGKTVSTTVQETTSTPLTSTPITPPNRISKVNTNVTHAVHSRQLLSSLRRKLGTTRLSRLPLMTKLFGEDNFNTTKRTGQSSQSPNITSIAAASQASNMVDSTEEHSNQASSTKDNGYANTTTSPAEPVEARNLHDTVDQEAINAMSHEQRITFLRAQITAFSDPYNAQLSPSLGASSHGNQEDLLDSLAVAAIHNLLSGIGNGFDQYTYRERFRDSDSVLTRHSLQISDTRTSDAATIVDGQVSAPDNLLREVLHRAYRLSGPARPPSVENNRNQNHSDGDALRSSSVSTIAAEAQRTASAGGGTSNRHSRQSLGRTSIPVHTEGSTSQPQLPGSFDMDNRSAQNNGALASASPPHQARPLSD